MAPATALTQPPCYYGSVRRAAQRTRLLRTPPVPRVVPDGVFDAFGWRTSDHLEWRRPADRWDDAGPVDGADPARMVFVFRDRVTPLPRELARLHALGLGLDDEEALAPWAIDAATDVLYARRARPSDVFWLAADNLNALFWGLHDWAHFHNHGPFEERAWTELQCDVSALTWLWLNRRRAALSAEVWERVRTEVEALNRSRFAAEGKTPSLAPLDAERLFRWAHAVVDASRGTLML